jgi:hypothetical protein
VQATRRREPQLRFAPARQPVEGVEQARVVPAVSAFSDPEREQVLALRLRLGADRHIPFDERIDDVELRRVVESVEVAREVDRSLEHDHGFGRPSCREPGLAEPDQRSHEVAVGARFLAFDERDGAAVRGLGRREVAAAEGHGARIGERIDEFTRPVAEARLGERDDGRGLHGGLLETTGVERRTQLGVRGEAFVRRLCDRGRAGGRRQQDQRRSKR